MAAVIPVNQYNQQDPSGSWFQVTQWSDGTYTTTFISPSQWSAYGIPGGVDPNDPMSNSHADVVAGTPGLKADESGTVVNASDPASGSTSKLVGQIFYVDKSIRGGAVIEREWYSDGHTQYLDTGQNSTLPHGQAAYTLADLVQGNRGAAPQANATGTGSQDTPKGSDGQTLWGQSAWTQASYLALYGGNAAQKWAQDHNAAIGSSGPTNQPTTPQQRVPPQTNPPVPSGRCLLPTSGPTCPSLTPWLLGGGLIVAAFALSRR